MMCGGYLKSTMPTSPESNLTLIWGFRGGRAFTYNCLGMRNGGFEKHLEQPGALFSIPLKSKNSAYWARALSKNEAMKLAEEKTICEQTLTT